MKTGNIHFIIFTAIICARHLLQLIVRSRRKKGGIISGVTSTLVLFLCYMTIWASTSYFIFVGVPLDIIFLMGATLMFVGIGMRIVAWNQLGVYYSEAIEIRDDHELITHGIYSLIRHPLHLSLLLELLGMSIISHCIYSAIPITVLAVTIAIRNKTEDAKLAEKFGADFERYSRDVPALNLLKGIARKHRTISRRST